MNKIEFEKVNVFEKQWVVTFVSTIIDDGGDIKGCNVNVFLPIDLGNKNGHELVGFAKSVFVPYDCDLAVGEVVALGFNRKQKVWYIKKQ